MATFSAIKKESEHEGVSETGEAMDSHVRVDGTENLLDVSQTIHQLFANSASAGSAGLLSPSQFLQASASAAISLPWLIPHYQQMLILQQRQQQQLLTTNAGEVEDGQLVMIPQTEEAQDTPQETSVIADSSPLISALLQRQVMAQLQQQQQQQQQNLIASGREVGTLVNLLGLQVPQVDDNARNVTTSKQQATIASESAPQRPKPPKKPLTPYMLFSKEHWHHVKAANSHLSTVTEIGAIIGSMWRELDAEQKLKYNERFTKDKIRYDEEIRAYLQNNNLSHSDLSRTRLNRKRPLSHHQQSQQLLNSAALTSTTSTLLHNVAINKPTSPTNTIVTQQPIELQQQLGAATSLIGSWSNQSLQQILASMGFTNQMIYSQSDGNNVIGTLQEEAESGVQQQEAWKTEGNRESPEGVESDQQLQRTSPMPNHTNAEAKVWTWHHHHQQGDNSSENNLPMALTKSSASTLLNNITSVHGYNSRSSNELEGFSLKVEKTENIQDESSLSEKVAMLETVLQDKDEEIERLKRKLEEAEMQIEQLKQNQPVQSAVSSSHSLDHPVSSSRSSELEESPQQQQGMSVANFES